MQFIINGKELIQALQKMQRVGGKGIDTLILRASQKHQHLAIHGQNSTRKSLIVMNCVVIKKGTFTIERIKLEGICKNRAKLEFTIDENGLSFKQEHGNYFGKNISYIPYRKTALLKLSNDKFIPENVQQKLLTAVRACLINSVFDGQLLALSISIINHEINIIIADNWHSAIARFPLDNKDNQQLIKLGFETGLTIPTEYGEILANQFSTGGLLIKANSKVVSFSNKELKVELPALQANSAMVQRATELDKLFDDNGIMINNADKLIHVLDNVKVIAKTNTPLVIDICKNKLYCKISFASPNGTISDHINIERRAKTDHKLNLEPNNAYDIIRKLRGDTMLSWSDRVVRFTTKVPETDIKLAYYSSMLQSNAS